MNKEMQVDGEVWPYISKYINITFFPHQGLQYLIPECLIVKIKALQWPASEFSVFEFDRVGVKYCIGGNSCGSYPNMSGVK
jgi:hypothetical protein